MYKKLLLSAIGIIGAVVLSFAEMKRPYFGYAPGHSQYKTLLTGDGCMLRGGTLKGIGKELDHEQYEYIFDHDWASIYVNKKLNMAVCKVLFKYDRFDDLYPTMQDLADDLDQVVQMAKEEGLYLMINYNSVYNDGWDIDKYMEYWKFFAGRYADEKHVFYELVNEPNCSYLQTDYHSVDTVAARWQRMYDVVRDRAPNTPILLFSWVHCFDEMHYNVLQEMDIDKSLTGVSFHLYCSNPLDHETMKNFKESGLGFLMTEQDGNDDVMDMENNGISWISWDGMRPGNWDWTENHNHNWEIPCVDVNTPPEVSITNPYTDTVIKAGNDIDLTADASDNDGNVSNVAFYKDGVKLGDDNSEPYSYSWANISTGTYNIMAEATDDSNKTNTSQTIVVEAVNNFPPAISISTPSDGDVFLKGSDIEFTADASDQDGNISKVEYFNGNNKIGESSEAPYSVSWSNVSAGDYTIDAVATDNENATGQDTISLIGISNSTNYEGEFFTDKHDCSITTKYDGFSGTGTIDFGGDGSWIEWDTVTSTGGNTDLIFTYANGDTKNRSCDISINGSKVGSVDFQPSGGFGAWTETNISVSLDQGINTVRITANTSAGGPNFDKMEVITSTTIVTSKSHSPVRIWYADNTLHIRNAKGQILQVIEPQGRIHYQKKVQNEYSTYNVTNLNKGAYIVIIRNKAKTTAVQKFIK